MSRRIVLTSMCNLTRLFILLLISSVGIAQIPATIGVSELRRIETKLASDEMRGRKSGTSDIIQAANFIAEEFKKAGLQPMQGNSFLQEFSMVSCKLMKVKAIMDDREVNSQDILVFSSHTEVQADEKSGFEIQYLTLNDNLFRKARALVSADKNVLVFVDTSLSKSFARLLGWKNQFFKMTSSIIFILGNYRPKKFKIKAENQINETKYSNVVGILPGKTRKEEWVIFSGHFDHLGVTEHPLNGDSIYNGANDDAAGTTAVITLAHYFKLQANNERSLVFAAFTAEEVGGFGSQYFSRQLHPAQVIAMLNIEMIGTESKWGKNTAYITGFEKSNLGELMQKNLQGTSFSFYPDPYLKENLFYRSDNATLAQLGVPAHTLSTAKMDNEPNYHRVSDEVSSLDLENMAAVIKAIALSSESIISGKDTPARIKLDDLKQ